MFPAITKNGFRIWSSQRALVISGASVITLLQDSVEHLSSCRGDLDAQRVSVWHPAATCDRTHKSDPKIKIGTRPLHVVGGAIGPRKPVRTSRSRPPLPRRT